MTHILNLITLAAITIGATHVLSNIVAASYTGAW